MSLGRAFLLITFLFAVSNTATAAVTGKTCYNTTDIKGPWFVASSTPYDSSFICGLSTTNYVYDDTGVTPTITLSIKDDGGSGFPYTCAEIAQTQKTSHGYYECGMKPSGIAGTVTTCMLASITKSPFEEVHIKFIGNDTTHVSIGFYTAGIAYQNGPVELNFQANMDFHRYAFEWTPNYIKWFVDGNLVASETGSRPIPTLPTRFIANFQIEQDGKVTDNSVIYTAPNVGRNFVFPSGAVVIPVESSFNNLTYLPTSDVSCGNGINPANINYTGGYDPSKCTKKDISFIYTDSLASGWSDSGSTKHSLSSNYAVRAGSNSISWDALPGAELYFRFNGIIQQSDFYSFEFWVYGGGQSQQQLDIQLLLPSAQTSASVNINLVLLSGVQAYSWSRVVLPFGLFSIPSDTPIAGFVIISGGTTFQGTMYFDQVLVGQQYDYCYNGNRSYAIYRDSLNEDWVDQSYGGISSLDSTKIVHSGDRSIEWYLYQNDGIKFHTDSPVDSDTYSAVELYVNPELLTGWKINIMVTVHDTPVGTMDLLSYYSGSFPPGTWVKVVIPFYQFGVNPDSQIDGLMIQCNTNDYQGKMYIDDVSFLSKLPNNFAVSMSSSPFIILLAFGLLWVLL